MLIALPLQRLRRVLLPAGAALAAVLIATPAAASTTLPLHAAQRGTTAAGFDTHSCDQIPVADQGAGSDGWVFVLPKNDANFLTLSLTFLTTTGNDVTVAIPDASDAYPDGITSNGTSKAWVVVPSGWTLLDGSATVDNPNTRAEDFNLTHTCVGADVPASPSASPGGTHSPSPSPSPPPSHSPSASASPSPSRTASPSPHDSHTTEGSSPATPTPPAPGGGGGGGGGGIGGLPVTGVALTGMTVTGASLVAGGLALLMVRRRRRAPMFVADDSAPEQTPEA